MSNKIPTPEDRAEELVGNGDSPTLVAMRHVVADAIRADRAQTNIMRIVTANRHEERAAILAFLRKHDHVVEGGRLVELIANAIERGEHLPKDEP